MKRKPIKRRVHSHTKLASDLIREWGSLDRALQNKSLYHDKHGRAALVKRKKRVGTLISRLEKLM